jgi:hypothetical protein
VIHGGRRGPWYFDTLGDLWKGAWESPEARSCEGILAVDRDRIRGNRSYSPETWHSRRVEGVDSPELLKPRVPEFLLTIDLIPRSILNHTISDIVFLTQKSARKDLARGFEPWSLGKVV